MKHLLLASCLTLAGCDIAYQVAEKLLERQSQKPPKAAATATPTIGEPPVAVDRCAPDAPLKSCKSAKFGDGKGGTLFKRSDTNPRNFAFLLPGNIRTFESVEVCSPKKCEKLPFNACANPDGVGERAHYKGALSLNPKAKWKVKFGECELEIKDNERTD